jgi:PhzF family phenazine biosynthesis protein
MKETPLWQVDAFTAEPFRGNPAAVCVLEEPRDAEWMQNVAAEMNLSETAFLVPRNGEWDLRWFTPAVEVALCGHATLASAHVLWESGRATGNRIRFATKSGCLPAERRKEGIVLDFPAYPPAPVDRAPDPVRRMLGVEPRSVSRIPPKGLGEETYLVELAGAAEVRGLRPDLDAIRAPGSPGVIVTARGDEDYDFVSRYFVPWAGIDEDPVTGSAHCVLAPFWGKALGKTRMTGYQSSARGGVVGVELAGDRVLLTGRAVTTVRGTLTC